MGRCVGVCLSLARSCISGKVVFLVVSLFWWASLGCVVVVGWLGFARLCVCGPLGGICLVEDIALVREFTYCVKITVIFLCLRYGVWGFVSVGRPLWSGSEAWPKSSVDTCLLFRVFHHSEIVGCTFGPHATNQTVGT